MRIQDLDFDTMETYAAISHPTQVICKRLSHFSAVCPTDLDFITRAQPFLTEYLIYPHVCQSEKEFVLDFLAEETLFKQDPQYEHYRTHMLSARFAEIFKQLEKRRVDVDTLRADLAINKKSSHKKKNVVAGSNPRRVDNNLGKDNIKEEK
jgi:hypothetical protein